MNFGAVGIRMKCARWSGPPPDGVVRQELHGVCLCTVASYGNAATRLADQVQSDGAYARGVDPDVEALYKRQARETGSEEARGLAPPDAAEPLRRVRFGPIYEFIWASAVGPRVAEPALLLIDPYRGRRRWRTCG